MWFGDIVPVVFQGSGSGSFAENRTTMAGHARARLDREVSCPARGRMHSGSSGGVAVKLDKQSQCMQRAPVIRTTGHRRARAPPLSARLVGWAPGWTASRVVEVTDRYMTYLYPGDVQCPVPSCVVSPPPAPGPPGGPPGPPRPSPWPTRPAAHSCPPVAFLLLVMQNDLNLPRQHSLCPL